MATVLNDQNYNSFLKSSDKLILIDFYADWCMPCQMMAPIVEEIAQQYSDVEVCKVNVDDNPSIAAGFAVQSIPTLVFIKNMQTLQISVGLQPKQDIEKIIEKYK